MQKKSSRDEINEWVEKLLTLRAQARKALVPESPFGFIVSVVVCIFIYAFSKKLSDNLLISNSFSIRTTHQQRARIVLRTFKLSFSSFDMMLFLDIAPEHWRRPQYYTDDRATIFELFIYIFVYLKREIPLAFDLPSATISTYNHRGRSLYNSDIFKFHCFPFRCGELRTFMWSNTPEHTGTRHRACLCYARVYCLLFFSCVVGMKRETTTTLDCITFNFCRRHLLPKKWAPIGSVVCAFCSDGWRRWMRRK